MKKSYITPKTSTIRLKGPVVMLGGSNEVNNFNDGGSINVGDEE